MRGGTFRAWTELLPLFLVRFLAGRNSASEYITIGRCLTLSAFNVRPGVWIVDPRERVEIRRSNDPEEPEQER